MCHRAAFLCTCVSPRVHALWGQALPAARLHVSRGHLRPRVHTPKPGPATPTRLLPGPAGNSGRRRWVGLASFSSPERWPGQGGRRRPGLGSEQGPRHKASCPAPGLQLWTGGWRSGRPCLKKRSSEAESVSRARPSLASSSRKPSGSSACIPWEASFLPTPAPA